MEKSRISQVLVVLFIVQAVSAGGDHACDSLPISKADFSAQLSAIAYVLYKIQSAFDALITHGLDGVGHADVLKAQIDEAIALLSSVNNDLVAIGVDLNLDDLKNILESFRDNVIDATTTDAIVQVLTFISSSAYYGLQLVLAASLKVPLSLLGISEDAISQLFTNPESPVQFPLDCLIDQIRSIQSVAQQIAFEVSLQANATLAAINAAPSIVSSEKTVEKLNFFNYLGFGGYGQYGQPCGK